MVRTLHHEKRAVNPLIKTGNVLDLVSVKGKGYLKKVSHNFI